MSSKHGRCPLFAALVPLIVGLGAVCSGQDAEKFSFDRAVKPFLAKHCLDCHSGGDPEAQFDLQKLPADFSADATANRWIDVMHSLQFGEMPPADEARPNAVEKANVIGWVFQEMAETGRYDAYRKKLLAPDYGNWVNHEKLFSGEIDTPPFSPSRLWRFSPEIFRHRGFGSAKSPYTYVTSETGIRDYVAMSKVDQSTVQMILIAADSFLEQREKRGEFKIFADEQPALTDQTTADTVRREFRRVIGREPTDDEQARYLAFLKKNIKLGGTLDGLKTTIKSMFLSPEAIYRMELGFGKTDKHGRRHLSPEELAYSLAYALTDHAPDRTPLINNAYQKGELKTKDDVARIVKQLLDEQLGTGHWDRRNLPRIMRFFEEFFGFDRAGVVFKDNEPQTS